MPGNEFGSAKWGEVRDFNEKYAAKDTGKTSSCLRRIRYCRKMYGFVMTPIHCETIMFSWLAVVVPERLHSFDTEFDVFA